MSADRPKSKAVPCTRLEFEALESIGYFKGFEAVIGRIPAVRSPDEPGTCAGKREKDVEQ